MKKLIILSIIFCSLNIYADDIVNIWDDNSPDRYGVSKDRVWLKSLFLSNFEYYETINTESSEGVLTAVTVTRDLFFLLQDLLKIENVYTKGTSEISIDGDIYTFKDSSIGLNISFSLEKPNQDILDLISEVYYNDSYNLKLVTDHYLESWVVRIYSAENAIDPDDSTITYDDILITATIIGESFQWLWGIHDGDDYIYKQLKE